MERGECNLLRASPIRTRLSKEYFRRSEATQRVVEMAFPPTLVQQIRRAPRGSGQAPIYRGKPRVIGASRSTYPPERVAGWHFGQPLEGGQVVGIRSDKGAGEFVISSLRKAKARNLRLADWLRFLGAVPNVHGGSGQPLEMTKGAGRDSK